MQSTKQLQDRRQSHRIKVCGVAVLRAGGTGIVCRIADLSTGGIALRSEDLRGLAGVAVGALVEIDLQLDPRQALRVSHEGMVRHVTFLLEEHRRVHRIALAVDGLLPTVAPALAGAVLHPAVKHFAHRDVEAAIAWAAAGKPAAVES